MSAPQPPADGSSRGSSGEDTARDAAAPATGADATGGTATYDFHGEQLDFDPYRFGRPEPAAPAWSPGAPAGPGADPSRPPTPGERWQPGGDAGPPAVKPGDYWAGAGSHRGTFPPAGYVPSPTDRSGAGDDRSGIDLSKPADPAGGFPPPSAPGSGYPPHGAPPPSYPASPPGAYPGPPPPATRGGRNGLAVAGLVLGIIGVLLAITSWPGILIGLVGLGLAIAGMVKARRSGVGKGLAVSALVLSIVAVVASTIVLVVVLSRIDFDCVVDARGDTAQAQECIR